MIKQITFNIENNMGLGEELSEGVEPMGRKKKKQNTTSYKSFHYLEDGSIEFSILSTKYSTKKLECGVYNLSTKSNGNMIVPKLEENTDGESFNHELSFCFVDKIDKIYNSFFDENIKVAVRKLGYNHKLGILLHGIAGTGKTSMFKKYFKDAVVKHKAIVFNIVSYESLSVMLDFISKIRKIQNNPIVIFMDEFETIFDYHGYESLLKSSMDGFNTVDNCMFMMATNYIEKVPKSIKERPSRVKYCIKVEGISDTDIISRFLQSSFDKVGLDIDFSEDVNNMKGWTIDELKQWVLDKIMDIEPEEKKSKSTSLI